MPNTKAKVGVPDCDPGHPACMDVRGLTACWHGDSDSGGVTGVLYGCVWSYSLLVWR